MPALSQHNITGSTSPFPTVQKPTGDACFVPWEHSRAGVACLNRVAQPAYKQYLELVSSTD